MANKNTKLKEPASHIYENLKSYILVGMLALAVYSNTFTGDFVFDDESVVLGDPSIMHLGNIPKYFTGQEGFHKVIGRYYRPVVSTSYAIDYALWEFKPIGFHITNVLIHIINTLLVFKLLMLLFKNVQHKYKTYFLLVGAGLFALHPIHTEAVAWVSGRTDSLFFTFFAAAFIFYLKLREEATTRDLFFVSLFYFLSLLSKEMAITFPAVIVLYEIIINKRRTVKEFLAEKTFYYCMIGVSALYLFIRWMILKDVPVRESYSYFYGKDGWTILFTMLQTVPIYFRLDFIPYGMLYHYSGYLPYVDTIGNIEVIFSLLFIIVMLGCAYFLRDKLSWLSFSIFFIFLTLLPVLNIIQTMNFMADRFLYLPSVALSFIAVGLLVKYYTPSRAYAVYSVIGAMVIFFAYLTLSRNADWKTNNALFMSAEGKQGTITYVNLGNIYANKQDYDKAESYYRKAIDLRKETILANNNLGKVFMIKGNFDSAYYYMYRAYSYDTLSPEPMYSIALLMNNTGRLDDAIVWLKKVHSVGPGYQDSKMMLQRILDRKGVDVLGDLPQEKPQLPDNGTAQLEKESYESYRNKDYDKAIEQLNKLMKLSPDNTWSYMNNIGMCYIELKKYDEAEKCFINALKIKSDFSAAHFNLATIYEKTGKKEKMKDELNKALLADPNNVDAQKKLKELGY